MITKFKIFEKNNYNPPKELLYDEARDLSKKRERINYYFYSNYEEGFDKIIGKLGIKRMSNTIIEKILKFAKSNNDQKLLDLINDYINYLEELKIKRESEKYNL